MKTKEYPEGVEVYRIRKEIETWEYLLAGLTYEHQASVRQDIQRKINHLKSSI